MFRMKDRNEFIEFFISALRAADALGNFIFFFDPRAFCFFTSSFEKSKKGFSDEIVTFFISSRSANFANFGVSQTQLCWLRITRSDMCMAK